MGVSADQLLIAVVILTAFSITFTIIPTLVSVARKKHLYENYEKREKQNKVVPTLGGIAIYAGFIISIALWVEPMPELNMLIAASLIMLIIGVKHDILVIASLKKFIGQFIAACLIVVFTELKIDNLHGLFSVYKIPEIVSFPLTIFFILFIINGISILDGIDGLAGGVTILITATLGTWFFINNNLSYAQLSWALAGVSAAFFNYNCFGGKNKVFMGDTGSLLVGFVIALLFIRFNQMNLDNGLSYPVRSAPAVSLAIAIVPLYDMLRLFFTRVLRGKSPFLPDKNHIHHKMINLGYSHIGVTLRILAVNIMVIILGFELHFLDVNLLTAILLLIAAFISVVPDYLYRKKIRPYANE